MANLTPEEKAERAHNRGLKANNVQRRRFEKMLNETLAPMASTQVNRTKKQRLELVEQGMVLEVLDGSLQRLVQIREQILVLKDEVKEIGSEAAEHGLSVDFGSSYSRSGLKYYSVPDRGDDNPDACTTPGVITNLVGFKIRRCDNNPWYKKLEQKLFVERELSVNLDFDVAELSQSIWGLVSTEEIMSAIDTFKTKWIEFTAGIED